MTTIVAVSGGPDSVALLRLLTSHLSSLDPKSSLVVAHFNHGWRETASEDERFVVQLASSLRLPCRVGCADASAPRSEASGRSLRYEFLSEVAHQLGARYLLTGHTADDQAETVLFHALRGSGLRGLRGIPRVRQLNESLTLRRPLLQFSRAQLANYLHDLDQPSCADTTNEDIRFTRNRIRHELIPMIRRIMHGDPRPALRRLGTLASEALNELQPAIDLAVKQAVSSRRPGSITLDCRAMTLQSSFIIREALAAVWQSMGWSAGEMTYARWCELSDIVTNLQDTVVTFPGNIRVVRCDDSLELSVTPDPSCPDH